MVLLIEGLALRRPAPSATTIHRPLSVTGDVDEGVVGDVRVVEFGSAGEADGQGAVGLGGIGQLAQLRHGHVDRQRGRSVVGVEGVSYDTSGWSGSLSSVITVGAL